MQGLTESRASQKAAGPKFHRKRGLTEGTVSQKGVSHRKEGLTESRVSQKGWSHGRKGWVSEGRVSQKAV